MSAVAEAAVGRVIPKVPWPVVPLGKVVEINPRLCHEQMQDDLLVSFVPMKCVEEESGRFVSLGDRRLVDVRKGYTPFQNGDVLFAKVTPCMENGKAAIIQGLTNGVGFGSTELFALRPSKILLQKFLFYFIIQESFRRSAAANMTGAVGLRRVPKSFLSEQPIPIPPLPEQRRIVAEIEKQFTRLDAGVAALRRTQANLKRYRAAVLKAACEGCLVHTNKVWREVALGEICSKITDGEHQTPKRHSTGRMLLSAKNVRSGFVDYNDHDFISEEDFQKCRTRCDAQPNDVLIVCVGATIGRTAIVRENTEFALVRSVALLRPYNVAPKYLLFAIQSEIGQKQISALKRGSAQASLYLHRIRTIRIPLPPLNEQARIVDEVERRFSVVNKLETVVNANLKRATRLRESILRGAFSASHIFLP